MKVKHQLSQYLAELIGTYFLIFFGCGSMIMAEIVTGYNSGFIPVIWGGAVSIMIYAVGHISGAHFNPAVTLAFWLVKKFPTKRVPGYIISQMAGALMASATHALIYGSEHQFGATIISIDLMPAFFLEVITSFSLMFVIMSVATDSRAVGELAGIAIGSAVAMSAFVIGPMTKASMNPARSIAPAIMSGEYQHLWMYIIAPIFGAALGAFTYNWIKCEEDKSESLSGCC
jgi:aquaporin NIP